jgi:hypothetical protein
MSSGWRAASGEEERQTEEQEGESEEGENNLPGKIGRGDGKETADFPGEIPGGSEGSGDERSQGDPDHADFLGQVDRKGEIYHAFGPADQGQALQFEEGGEEGRAMMGDDHLEDRQGENHGDPLAGEIVLSDPEPDDVTRSLFFPRTKHRE